MEDDAPSWLYSAPLATLLLCGAVAVYLLGYLPEAEKARECEERVRLAQARIQELTHQEHQARRRIAELQDASSEAIEEAAREVFHFGSIGDFLPASGKKN